jgi:hypothetical protein
MLQRAFRQLGYASITPAVRRVEGKRQRCGESVLYTCVFACNDPEPILASRKMIVQITTQLFIGKRLVSFAVGGDLPTRTTAESC